MTVIWVVASLTLELVHGLFLTHGAASPLTRPERWR